MEEKKLSEKPLQSLVNLKEYAELARRINAGCNLNERDHTGETALHCAAKSGDFRATAMLMMARADVNVMDEMRRTPLHFAHVRRQSWEYCEMLRAAGAKDSFENSKEESQ